MKKQSVVEFLKKDEPISVNPLPSSTAMRHMHFEGGTRRKRGGWTGKRGKEEQKGAIEKVLMEDIINIGSMYIVLRSVPGEARPFFSKLIESKPCGVLIFPLMTYLPWEKAIRA